MELNKLVVESGQGLTSCLSVRLHEACRFYESRGYWPIDIDSRMQFSQYQDAEPIADRLVEYNREALQEFESNGFDHGWQMGWFDDFDLVQTSKLANAICQPSIDVIKRANTFYQYLIGRVGVLFRGNDKAKEMKIAEYDDMIKMAKASGGTRFFLQTDEQEFCDYFVSIFPNTTTFDFIPRINKNPDSYVSPPIVERVDFIINFNAVLLAMSRMETICLTQGNTSLWTALYRGNLDGVLQLHTGHNSCIKIY